jgi:hypothetical protein
LVYSYGGVVVVRSHLGGGVNTDSKDHLELLKLQFEEFKYRHELFWKLFFSFSLAILFLLALPYAYPDKVGKLRDLITFLPIAALVITLLCYWLLRAEYQRLAAVRRQLDELKPKGYKQATLAAGSIFEKLLNLSVGKAVANIFLVGFLTLSVIELLFIRRAV